jgi:alpha,alpha-trehalase
MKPSLAMHKIAVLTVLLFLSCEQRPEGDQQSTSFYQPWVSLGPLWHEVQMQQVFEDSKTFADCTPLGSPLEIKESYLSQRSASEFDLEGFVAVNFDEPANPEQQPLDIKKSFSEHLTNHWRYLTRSDDRQPDHSTLIALPEKYVIPGGRFREIYYWDSYFTMLGLIVSERNDLFQNMLDNFQYLIDTVGFVPNGNRTYYLGRSQPPYFGAMVSAYAANYSWGKALQYLPALEREYQFWMKGADQLEAGQQAIERVVRLEDHVLNRYWDNYDQPRPESYREDVELAENLSDQQKKKLYRNLRAGAESGWDYSARWFSRPDDFASIRTIDILPVDLNSLLYHTEQVLSRLYQVKGDQDRSRNYLKLAERRYDAINSFFWNESEGVYQDVLWKENTTTGLVTAASFYPMYFKVARQDYAELQVPVLFKTLLQPGGLATTGIESGQQWDFPNGWAPLQWLAIEGLRNYGFTEKAEQVADRWLRINQKVFARTGKMMEKYNVSDTSLLAGGGEYPNQDGFGWTNGVALCLMADSVKYQ